MLIKHSSFFNNVKLKYITTGRMLYCVSYDSVLQCRTPHKPERTPQMLAVWAPQHWLYTFLPGHNLGKPSCWVYLVAASICWWQNQSSEELNYEKSLQMDERTDRRKDRWTPNSVYLKLFFIWTLIFVLWFQKRYNHYLHSQFWSLQG